MDTNAYTNCQLHANWYLDPIANIHTNTPNCNPATTANGYTCTYPYADAACRDQTG
jgi:hypothetical protein